MIRAAARSLQRSMNSQSTSEPGTNASPGRRAGCRLGTERRKLAEGSYNSGAHNTKIPVPAAAAAAATAAAATASHHQPGHRHLPLASLAITPPGMKGRKHRDKWAAPARSLAPSESQSLSLAACGRPQLESGAARHRPSRPTGRASCGRSETLASTGDVPCTLYTMIKPSDATAHRM